MAEKDPKKVLLGSRIRELREQAGLSREQMAAAAGVSVRAIVQWELGEREPGWFNITSLADALGVDCRAFLEEPSTTPEPKRGRPTKHPVEASETAKPKRPRGRPRKAT